MTQSNLKIISLDDLYHMVSYIYSDKNSERPISMTFSHFVEVCGMLTIHGKNKNREEVNMEAALCKALGWFFPLMAKLKVKSLQELLFRKYPNVCPYCRLPQHQEGKCKQVLGTAKTVNHSELRDIYEENKSEMPVTLNEWQKMFNNIYPRDIKDKQWSLLSLLEELGEFAEALRVFDLHPKYVAGEAADVFSYLMGIANEHSMKLTSKGQQPFDFEKEFIARYPGVCPQCGYQVCVCPVIPEATVGRMAKELDLFPNDNLFSLDLRENDKMGQAVANRLIDNYGGLLEYVKKFPFDRGDTNRALVTVCVRLSSILSTKNPQLSREMNEVAINISQHHKHAGVKSDEKEVESIIKVLDKIITEVDVEEFSSDGAMPKMMVKELQAQACRFGIITALPKEFAAVKAMLEDSFDYNLPNDSNTYVIGRIPHIKGEEHNLVAVALMKQYGNNDAAITTANLQRSFPHITEIMMVGIAGGIPFPNQPINHVRLADIVVSNTSGIMQYDNLRIDIDKITVKDNSPKPSAALIDVVNQLEVNRVSGKYPWEIYISKHCNKIENGCRPSDTLDILYEYDDMNNHKAIAHPVDDFRTDHKTKIHHGKIGAANILLKNPHLRDKLRRDCNIIAVEMEASGVADSSWSAGNNYLIIRGIADYCDPMKNDIWQEHASICAAAYTRCIIERYPPA